MSHPWVKISLWRPHAQTVKDGAFSHKTNFIDILSEILNLEEHLNLCISSEVTSIFLNGCILITGGVASGRVYPAACAACLFQIGNPFKLKQQKGFENTLFDVNSLYVATLCLSKDVKLEKAFIKDVCIREVGYHKGKTIMFIVWTD